MQEYPLEVRKDRFLKVHKVKDLNHLNFLKGEGYLTQQSIITEDQHL